MVRRTINIIKKILIKLNKCHKHTKVTQTTMIKDTQSLIYIYIKNINSLVLHY